MDKLTLAALEATLRGPESPTRQALHRVPDELRERAEALAKRLCEAGIAAEAVPTAAVVGGGGAPEVELPSWAVALAAGLAEPLRAKAVVGRVERGRLLLDLRCVPPDRDGDIYAAVRET